MNNVKKAGKIMYLANIYVTYKPSILDPQGDAIKNALHRLNYNDVNSITQGKYFQTELKSETQKAAEQTTDSICKSLLANPNMETYRFNVKKVES